MYSCGGKAKFSAAITQVFRVTCSFRNLSNLLIFPPSWLNKYILFEQKSSYKNLTDLKLLNGSIHEGE